MKFSLLLSVYSKDEPSYLDGALYSIEMQTLPPNEIVLVKDGPLTEKLDEVIKKHIEHPVIKYKILALEKNVGLGEALNAGLDYCSQEWIARMDSDDIALPERFRKQLAYIDRYPDVDILGGWICEFDKDLDRCSRERRVPLSHNSIVRFANYRNPINHVTVLFRKSAVEDAGGYLAMRGFEDYYLWMRMLKYGKRFANLPEVLVRVRVGDDMIRRRQGWHYAKDELTLEKAAYQIGFWSALDVGRNFFIRFLPRLLPVFMVEKLYNVLRKF
jgi:glycosyltransferase involved in cell wall biosynthesis